MHHHLAYLISESGSLTGFEIITLIVEAIIGIGAVVAAIYAMKTYNDMRKSRRAMVASAENPGKFEAKKIEGSSVLSLLFENYGVNLR